MTRWFLKSLHGYQRVTTQGRERKEAKRSRTSSYSKFRSQIYHKEFLAIYKVDFGEESYSKSDFLKKNAKKKGPLPESISEKRGKMSH